MRNVWNSIYSDSSLLICAVWNEIVYKMEANQIWAVTLLQCWVWANSKIKRNALADLLSELVSDLMKGNKANLMRELQSKWIEFHDIVPWNRSNYLTRERTKSEIFCKTSNQTNICISARFANHLWIMSVKGTQMKEDE